MNGPQMIRVLIISSLVFGLGTLVLMLMYAFRKKFRQNRVCTMVVVFGTLGLVIASMFSAVALVRNDDSASSAGLLWPTSIMLMAGEPGDTFSATAVVFGMAILGNVGAYGFVGLIVGSVWAFVSTRRASAAGDQ